MKKQSKIIMFFIVFCLIFSLGGCGGDSTTSVEPSEESSEEPSEEPSKEPSKEPARNDALIDAIVGEWGFVAPLWSGTVPAGFTTTEQPLIRFYLFTDIGSFAEYRTYVDSSKKITPLYTTGQYTLDEQNSAIYLTHDEQNKKTELRYVFEDGNLELYGGFYATGSYRKDYETELFKADWESLWEGIGLEKADFIQAVAEDNPDFVPDFFKQSKNAASNAELGNALVGQWGTVTPSWMEDLGYGTYKRRPALFCYDFTEDGKVVLTYTTAADDGTQEIEGVYYWNEENNTITLSFIVGSAEFSYSFQDGAFKLYGGFFDGRSFTQEGLIELFQADWSEECSSISGMSRGKLDDYLKDYLKEHPEYESDFFSKN